MDDYDYLKNKTLKITSKEILKKILAQERLVNKTSLSLLDHFSMNENVNDVYFGTGISNPSELSVGIPFDFLIYPLVANRVRNSLGDGHIHHLIADNHALLNKFDEKNVKKIATKYRNSVEDIIDKMGIVNYHVYLSSEIATDKKYKQLLLKVNDSAFTTDYAKFEAADIEYFRQTRDVIIKLGWKFNGDSKFDEQSFDKEYINNYGNNIIPIYTAPGKKFSDKSPNSVPYTLYKNDVDSRFVISNEEDIIKKIELQKCTKDTLNMIQNHYKGVIRLFEDTIHQTPTHLKSTWEKLQHINQFLTI